MSDTQAKATPSKAAYDLGKLIREKYIAANPAEVRESINQDIAQMCQSALHDLLEKAEAFRAQNYNRIGVREFVKALEPWKPQE